MQKLQDLKAKEVSLVSQGANRRRFMIFKSAEPTREELQKAIAETDPEVMKSLDEVLDRHLAKAGDDGAVRTMLKAIARIKAGLKGKKVPPEALAAVGFSVTPGEMGGAGATTVGEAPSHGEKIEMAKEPKTEEMEKAAMCAQKAYDEEMQKLGYPKYPDAQIQMKSKVGKTKKSDDDDEEEEVEKHATLAPEAQAKLDAIFKANEDLTKSLAAADVVNKELRAEITALQAVNSNRELVQKAASFTNLGLPQEMVVQTLSDAQKAGKDAFDRIVKQYEMLNERARVEKSFGGNLYGEIGTTRASGAGAGSDTTWARIEKAAEGFVEKSAFKGSKAEAVAAFLNTAEGTALYAEHQRGRKDGI